MDRLKGFLKKLADELLKHFPKKLLEKLSKDLQEDVPMELDGIYIPEGVPGRNSD